MPESATIDRLLADSSRTFALSIPMLPDPVRSDVGVAYLLFRLADTIEDEDGWDDPSRVAGLELMREALDRGGSLEEASSWLPELESPLKHKGYARLFEEAGMVAAAFDALDAEAREMIASHLVRTLNGMVGFVQRGRATRDLNETLKYCYSVAGIVGELCTALFVRHEPSLQPRAQELGALAVKYGEGLQLVNILRDALADRDASRGFLPEGVTPRVLIPIACEDLAFADRYVQLLRDAGASAGVVAFNLLNVKLAHESLGLIEQNGAGVKLERRDVERIVGEVRESCGIPL